MSFCLGVDIGNSGVRLSTLDLATNTLGEPFRITWQLAVDSTPQAVREDRYAPHDPQWLQAVDQFLTHLASERSAPADGDAGLWWIVSSVRGDALSVLSEYVGRRRSDRLHLISHRDVPLNLAIDYPERLGIDRLLAGYAATFKTELRPLLVIQAGSAVTVDLISREASGRDVFEGGAILPGVPMMLRLLGQAADMLPEMDADDLTDLPAIPGKNTEAAMTCGAASALIGGVQHLLSRYRAAYGEQLPVILSGGDGMRLSPYISGPLIVEPHLVQRGVLMVAQAMHQHSE